MTIEDIRTSTRPMLRPVDVAPIIGCDPQWVRDTAKTNPAALGFPAIVVGKRTRIPRIPFLRYLGYEDAPEGATGSEESRAG